MRRWCDVNRFTRRRNGRRRTLLGLLGTIWLLYGWAIVTSPPPTLQPGRFPSVIDRVLQNPWSGILWAGCGLVGISAALLPRKRLPDSYGFAALIAPALLWTVLGAWSWLIYRITGHFGNPRAWVLAAIWSAVVSVLFLTSGWPDPSDTDGDET